MKNYWEKEDYYKKEEETGEEVLTRIITIRNRKIKRSPRICDAIVTIDGQILRLEMKNIKGAVFVDFDDINAQIQEALVKNLKAN